MAIEFRLPLTRDLELATRIWRPRRVLVPAVDPAELVGADHDLRLIDLKSNPGNVRLDELVFICLYARRVDARAVFEIGTCDGRTTATLALNLPEAEIHTIDLPAERIDTIDGRVSGGDRRLIEKPHIGAYLERVPGRVTQHLGNSLTYDYAVLEGRMDLVFIDGNHRYDYVLADSATALRLLKPSGGHIVWHDFTGLRDVTRAVHHLYQTDPRFAGIRHVRGTTLGVMAT